MEERKINYYIMGYMDLMGQTAILKQMQDFPDSSEGQKSFMEKTEATINRVEEFRTIIKNFIDKVTHEKSSVKFQTPEHQQFHEKYTKANLDVQFFTDSAIICTSLHEKDVSSKENPSILPAIYSMLSLFSLCMLQAFAKGYTIRGALEVGLASKMINKDYYGPIAEELKVLEKRAGYSRILVGQRFIEYLNGYCEDLGEIGSQDYKIVISYLKTFKQCLYKEDDKIGFSYLRHALFLAEGDQRYGHPEFKKALDELLPCSCAFIRQQIKTSKDDKIRKRFVKVREYFKKEHCWR